jgi:hypothetical protein
MKTPICVYCEACVLELDGQFEKLDSYFIDDPLLENTVGWWHASCLSQSDFGLPWFEARLRNFRDVRGYRSVVDTGSWTVVEHARTREVLALGRNGLLLDLSVQGGRARPVEGGAVYPVASNEFNIDLTGYSGGEAAIAVMQAALVDTGSYPIADLLQQLGVADRVMHPPVLEAAVFRFDGSLRRYFGSATMSAQAEYGVFIPSELHAHLRKASR